MTTFVVVVVAVAVTVMQNRPVPSRDRVVRCAAALAGVQMQCLITHAAKCAGVFSEIKEAFAERSSSRGIVLVQRASTTSASAPRPGQLAAVRGGA